MIVLDVNTVRLQLPAYGYTPDEGDEVMIKSALQTSIQRAMTLTNQKKMPDGLKYEVLKMAIGEFLFIKKVTGGLEDGSHGIKFKARITQFTEGDTNVSATDRGKNDEQNFEDWLDRMRFGDPWVLEHYRKLHW